MERFLTRVLTKDVENQLYAIWHRADAEPSLVEYEGHIEHGCRKAKGRTRVVVDHKGGERSVAVNLMDVMSLYNFHTHPFRKGPDSDYVNEISPPSGADCVHTVLIEMVGCVESVVTRRGIWSVNGLRTIYDQPTLDAVETYYQALNVGVFGHVFETGNEQTDEERMDNQLKRYIAGLERIDPSILEDAEPGFVDFVDHGLAHGGYARPDLTISKAMPILKRLQGERFISVVFTPRR